MRYIVLHLFVVLICFSSNGQGYDFHNPIEGPLQLTATFGELRPNHFHMGIDVSTNKQVGKKLFTIESGYISRIKISPYGYGKAIYINHPQGITTVYAHCDHFTVDLENLIDSLHYSNEENELDLLLDSTVFPLKKGQHFAYSGNTGSSSGPHLHFEIRDTKSEVALNPLLFGFKIKDNTAPVIKSITIFCIDTMGYKINNISQNVIVNKVGTDTYQLNPIILNNQFNYSDARIGLAIETLDKIDGTSRNFGIYSTLLQSGKDTLSYTVIDSISFDHTRYVNTHADYRQYKDYKRKSHNLYHSISTPLQIYKFDKTGVLPFVNQELNLKISDFNGNTIQLVIPLQILETETKSSKVNYDEKYFLPEDSFIYETNWARLSFPSHLVYEPELKHIQSNTNTKTINVGNKNTVIQTPYKIEFNLDSTVTNKEKYYISINNNYLASTISNYKISAESKSFGLIQLKSDYTKPIVYPINYKNDMTTLTTNKLVWKIKEETTTVVSYNVYFNNQWHPLVYNPKNQTVTCYLNSTMFGLQKIRLEVVDACGNKTIIENNINLSKI
jgi:hypothetical protein